MLDALWGIGGLLVLLGILVTFHEWGHYWVAKKLGVKAVRFSVGFGKPFWSRIAKDGTEFAIAPIPLGGYVKFVDENEGSVAEEDLPYAFNRQPVWKRFLIVLAGPMANFLLAITVYAAVYMLGIAVSKPFVSDVKVDSVAYKADFPENSEILSINGEHMVQLEDVLFTLVNYIGDDEVVTIDVRTVEGETETVLLDMSQWIETGEGNIFDGLGLSFGRFDGLAVLGTVGADTPAERSGLQVGDRILGVQDQEVTLWSDFVSIIHEKENTTVPALIERNGSLLTIDISMGSTRDEQGNTRGYLGVNPNFVSYNVIDYGFMESVENGVYQTGAMIQRIGSFLGKLVTGKISTKNIGGPVGIAQGAGQTAQAGIVAFLLYLAMISVNLGFINLLPIPMLDGGHLMYYLAEMVRGKPVSEKIMELGMRVGIILVLTLMAVALFNDINRL